MPFVYFHYKLVEEGDKKNIAAEHIPLPSTKLRDLEELETIMPRALEMLEWKSFGEAKWALIAPNRIPSYHLRSYGQTECLTNAASLLGISRQEVGFWLDKRMNHQVSIQGKQKFLRTEPETIMRMDRRKPIYMYDNKPAAIVIIGNSYHDNRNV